MRATGIEARLRSRIIPLTARILPLALAALLTLESPVHADPLLFETGIITGSLWFVIAGGLLVESLILTLFIRRKFIEILAACVLANLVSGFTGFVVLLFVRINGVPLLPPVPTMLAAVLIEAPILALILVRPPIRRLIPAVITANLATAIIAMVVMVPLVLSPEGPGTTEDLDLARKIGSVRKGIDIYYEEKGYFPEELIGGQDESVFDDAGYSDPLLSSGILDSYPVNPYAPYLRSQRLNLAFLLTGFGAPTRQVDLDEPTNEWEMRWFPIFQCDPRFGDPEGMLLCANGLTNPDVAGARSQFFYHMNGADCVPGSFFYRSYDFNLDGYADDYILGAYGWPTGEGTTPLDLIDARTGEISLCLSQGCIYPGEPDGNPEPVIMVHVAGTPVTDE